MAGGFTSIEHPLRRSIYGTYFCSAMTHFIYLEYRMFLPLFFKTFLFRPATMRKWYLVETNKAYGEATKRYEEISEAKKGTSEHKEKLLLVFLISDYEKGKYMFNEVVPIEMIKLHKEDFGYKPAYLAKAFSDKGTFSEGLNYKQLHSLKMSCLFSKMLRIPEEALLKKNTNCSKRVSKNGG